MRGYAVKPGESEGLLATKLSSGGSLTVMQSRTTGGAPRHVHDAQDEAMFVLSGGIWVACGDERWELPEGGFAFLPAGVPHEWDVTSGEATLLIITTPGGLEEFLEEFHAAPRPLAAADADAIAARHGIRWVRD